VKGESQSLNALASHILNRAKGPRGWRRDIWLGSASDNFSFARGRLPDARDIGVRPDLGRIQESRDSNTEKHARTTEFTERKTMTL
jgi:hypothetical protein